MPRDGNAARRGLLDAAQELVLERGFAGAGVEAIVARAGLTKGAFFHHFPDKRALADSLVERWADGDAALLDRTMERAARLVDDPLQQLLVFVGLLIEDADALLEPESGCLFGALCYQDGLLAPVTTSRISDAMLLWRSRLADHLRLVAERHPPRLDVDPASLADTLTVTFEGAYILARSTRDPQVLADQLRHERNYLLLLFGG